MQTNHTQNPDALFGHVWLYKMGSAEPWPNGEYKMYLFLRCYICKRQEIKVGDIWYSTDDVKGTKVRDRVDWGWDWVYNPVDWMRKEHLKKYKCYGINNA